MIQNEQHDKIVNEYFEWMYHLVCNNKNYNKLSYRKLLYFLYTQTFVAIVPMDENRVSDGIDFRYRFGYENGYSDEYIKRYLDTKECSVLEVMISLAYRVEEQIMDNTDFGNRTGQWFWSMIVSLGLGSMHDDRFDQIYCELIVDDFVNRNYNYNGRGGLFTLSNPYDDMTKVDIWCQFMWYLNENFKD